MNTVKNTLIIAVMAIAAISCSKSFDIETIDSIKSQISVQNQGYTGQIVLGKKLNNPYSIHNIKAAWRSIRSNGVAEPEVNCLYVRFLPKDSAEFRAIENLELFCYPLDYEILQEGDFYHDPTIPADEITWQYTTVTPDYEFPNIKYEILDECFIPESNPGTKAAASYEELELEAIALSGNEVHSTCATKSGSTRPRGCVKVYDFQDEEFNPVAGIKVKCTYFIKVSTAYTDADGNYSMNTSFPSDPEYKLIFSNKRNFTIWNGIWVLGPACANYGTGSASGRDFIIDKTNATKATSWYWATINNGVNRYLDWAKANNVPTLDRDIKIMAISEKGAYVGSAPMLRSTSTVYHMFSKDNALYNIPVALCNIMLAPYSTYLLLKYKWAMPDITLNIDTDKYFTYSIQRKTFHEMAHTSHCAVAGSGLWNKYCSAILSNGFDYDGGSKKAANTEFNDGIIDLGESWAETVEALEFGGGTNGLFEYNLFLLFIAEDGVLTPSEIINCMTSDVDNSAKHYTKLCRVYSDRSEKIQEVYTTKR